MTDEEPTARTPDSGTLDTIHDLLSHQRRRSAIAVLDKHGSIALADLAEEVTRHEREVPITETSEEEVLRVYLSLWHVHIPKLAEADVVEYDQETDMVGLGEYGDQVREFLSQHTPEETT